MKSENGATVTKSIGKIKPLTIDQVESDLDVVCLGIYSIRSNKSGAYVVDNTGKPGDEVVFLVRELVHEGWGSYNYYITDGKDMWVCSELFYGSYARKYRLTIIDNAGDDEELVLQVCSGYSIQQPDYDAILKEIKKWCNKNGKP